MQVFTITFYPFNTFLMNKSITFLKIKNYLKTEVMMLKIQLCFTGINYILKYIKIETFYFKFQ